MSLSIIPGYRFHDGALGLASTGVEMRLTWDPVPAAEMRIAHGRWQPYHPEFRILAPTLPIQPDIHGPDKETLQTKHDAFLAFRACLPGDIAQAVEPFTCHQWPMLTLLRGSKASLDLAQTNPVLAYALANNAQIRASSSPGSAMEAIRHSHMKKRDILGWLGFPETDAMVRIIKKVSPAIAYPGLIRKLRQCVQSPEILKMFGHLPSVNTGIIFIASHADMAALVTPKLLQEMVSTPEEGMGSPTADLLSEIVTAASEMHNKTQLRPFTSRQKVQECHDLITREHQAFKDIVRRQEEIKTAQRKLTENFNFRGKLPVYLQEQVERLQAEYKQLEARRPDRLARPEPLRLFSAKPAVDMTKLRALRFPSPPIPGTKTIIPLTSFGDFEEEAAAQAICLGLNLAYLDRVVRGELYVYRVLAPERHTLAIVKRGTGCWQIAELRQSRNAACTESTETAICHWLSKNQLSL